jgi:hypothetical protein
MTHTGVADIEDPATPVTLSGTAAIKEALVRGLFSVNSVRLVRSLDNWRTMDTTSLAVDAATGAVTGAFPPLSAPAVVHYYLLGYDNFGSKSTLPAGAPQADFVYVAGYRSRMLHTAEQADGWTVSGDAKRGLWIRDLPIGTYSTSGGTPPDVPWVQTNEDHTPGAGNTKCWITGNAAASLGMNSNDVDSGKTILTSPLFALSGYHDPLLRYYRWYTNGAGNNPGSDPWFVRVSSNGGASWINIEYTTKSDAAWTPRIIRLRDYIALTDSVALMFIAADNAPESTVEAAVDDVEILDGDAVSAARATPGLPDGLTLDASFPNPAEGDASVRYTLPSRGAVTVRVLTLTGQTVLEAAAGMREAGPQLATLATSTLAPGTYLCQIEWSGYRISRPLLVIR